MDSSQSDGSCNYWLMAYRAQGSGMHSFPRRDLCWFTPAPPDELWLTRADYQPSGLFSPQYLCPWSQFSLGFDGIAGRDRGRDRLANQSTLSQISADWCEQGERRREETKLSIWHGSRLRPLSSLSQHISDKIQTSNKNRINWISNFIFVFKYSSICMTCNFSHL